MNNEQLDELAVISLRSVETPRLPRSAAESCRITLAAARSGHPRPMSSAARARD
jgi:hypothetical protein